MFEPDNDTKILTFRFISSYYKLRIDCNLMSNRYIIKYYTRVVGDESSEKLQLLVNPNGYGNELASQAALVVSEMDYC